LERHLHQLSSEPELAGRVHFLGSREDVSRLLSECVLLVHAARQEPLGRVLLEAAACGVPVVATDVGGTREIFPTETDGAVVVPVDNPTAIAATVNALLSDAERRQRLGAAGRRRAKAAFDVRNASARLIDLYRHVLNL
jgi:glycosyltransferase involved in cell wall biosynthesis